MSAAGAGARVAVYFVASPLHYLAARRVATAHEAGSRQVLVCYRPSLAGMVVAGHWDAVVHMPWPRFDPLPGPFGRVRRTLANLRAVVAAAGPCDELVMHSPVYDTEAINYFVHALPRLTGARRWHARILPDGLLNLSLHPLSPVRRAAQQLRRLRRLAHPLLRYTPFAGDRIGSQAAFVDRIYVLDGFPSPYDARRTVPLGPLVPKGVPSAPDAPVPRRALVVGQPLVAVGLLTEDQREAVAQAIDAWLQAEGVAEVNYKRHPRERAAGELMRPRYQELHTELPLEAYLAAEPHAWVAGCCSTALYTARQIGGPGIRIAAFGVGQVRFSSAGARDNALALMRQLGIDIH